MEDHGDLDFIVSAPGKVILFGEHSIVYKKSAVSTSINKRLSVIVSPSQESKISVKFPQIDLSVVFPIEELEKLLSVKCRVQSSSSTLNLGNPEDISLKDFIESMKADLINMGINEYNLKEKSITSLLGFFFVMRGMFSILNCSLVPFNLEVSSDLEVGAGTGSSAAFAVAVSGAVYHYLRCVMRRNNKEMTIPITNDYVEIKSYPAQSGFKLNDVKIINKWAFCIEKLMHGNPSGIDNTTCTFGSIVVTSRELIPGQLTFCFLENFPKITILLISTGISRNTSNLVVKVRQLRERNCTAVNAIFNAMDVIALEAFKTLDDLGTSNSDQLYNVLGGLMDLNHGLLRTIGVSHERLERIVSVSACYGLSCKLTGAGGGGYAITLVPPNYPTNKLEDMKMELGSSYKVTEINIGEDGVKLEKLVK